jgi:ribosomal protein S18 acetylase RimI-like enzyme
VIIYKNEITELKPEDLTGFFEGWQNPPNPEKRLKVLENSTHVIIAVDDTSGKIIGFINAISDKTLSAYVPLLEVLPEYRDRGIGSELVKRMITQLEDLYMIDICCDEEMAAF